MILDQKVPSENLAAWERSGGAKQKRNLSCFHKVPHPIVGFADLSPQPQVPDSLGETFNGESLPK